MFETYWIDPSQWPRETRRHIPLARAVLEIGAATVEGWTGREPSDSVKLLPGFRPFKHATHSDRTRAHRLLKEAKADYEPRPNFRKMPSNFTSLGINRVPDLEDYHLSPEQYEQAITLLNEKNAPFVPGAMRLAQAKQEFIRAATMCEFATAVLETNSFRIGALDPDIWSVVNPFNVFLGGQLNPSKPKSIAAAGTEFRPVMVERESFDTWLTVRPPTKKASYGASGDRAEIAPRLANISEENNKPAIEDKRLTSKSDLESEYIERVRSWPRDMRPPSRSEDERAFRGKAKREEVRAWRRKHAPANWQISGRPNLAE